MNTNSNLEAQDMDSNRFSMKKSVGHGPILELSNVTTTKSGWFICCLFYSKINNNNNNNDNNINNSNDTNDEEGLENADDFLNSIDYSCSSAKLTVLPNEQLQTLELTKAQRSKLIIISLILVGCVILLSIMGLFTYIGYRKYIVYTKTLKAAQTMHIVSICLAIFCLYLIFI